MNRATAQPLVIGNSGSTHLQALGHWPKTALGLLAAHSRIIRVVIAQLRGSGPREAGACLLVTPDHLFGTIGGGYLEWEALRIARAMLANGTAPDARRQRFILGTELGQCCGGVVELWFEPLQIDDSAMLHALQAGALRRTHGDQHGRIISRTIDAEGLQASPPASAIHEFRRHEFRIHEFHMDEQGFELTERCAPPGRPLYVYGAGHVGQALIPTLAALPFAVQWIDARAELFPRELPESIAACATALPLATVERAAPGSCFIVMTHDHALDFALCLAILRRGDAAYVGVIGSHSKAARFRSRLAQAGLSAAQIAPLICPIGIAGIISKEPAAIAISIAAQLLQLPAVAPNPSAQVDQPAQPFTTKNETSAGTAPEQCAPQLCAPDQCASCPQANRHANRHT